MTLSDLKTIQLITAYGAIKGIPVTPKSFNTKKRAIERIEELMEEFNLSMDDVYRAAGIRMVDDAEPEAPNMTKANYRTDTKQAKLIDLLSRDEGATVTQMQEATGWKAHTVRGAISGALRKKLGLTVTSTKGETGLRTYRIAS